MKPFIFKNNLFLLIIGLAISLSSSSQTPTSGKVDFIIIDSAQLAGKVVEVRLDAIYFLRTGEKGSQVYTADQVDEFEKQGDFYKSFLLNGKRFFFKRIVKGQVSLFEMSTDFYLLQDTVLTKLEPTGNEYQNQLRGISTACTVLVESVNTVKYKRNSLILFLNQFNEGRCQARFPRSRIGVFMGYQGGALKFDQASQQDYKTNSWSVIPGAYYELPLFLSHRFTFNAEVFFERVTYSVFEQEIYSDRTGDTYLEYDLKTIVIPTTVKYYVLNKRMNVYVKAGSTFHIRVNSEEVFIESSDYGTYYTADNVQITKLKSFSIGIIGGMGVEYPLTPSKSLFLESRFLSWGIERGDGARSKFQNVSVIVGLNF